MDHLKLRGFHQLLLLVCILMFTSVSNRALAQIMNPEKRLINRDMISIDVMDKSTEAGPKNHTTHKFYILPTKLQGELLHINLRGKKEKKKFAVYEIHDMKGNKQLAGTMDTHKIVNISELRKELYVVSIRSVDSLMQIDLVIE